MIIAVLFLIGMSVIAAPQEVGWVLMICAILLALSRRPWLAYGFGLLSLALN